MFTRISSALLICAALSACGSEAEPLPGDAIACALGGSASFVEECTMERQQREGASLLIVRHPDGGFRRFELGVAGRGMVVADGVEQAILSQGEGIIEISVGADRYRLPVAQ